LSLYDEKGNKVGDHDDNMPAFFVRDFQRLGAITVPGDGVFDTSCHETYWSAGARIGSITKKTVIVSSCPEVIRDYLVNKTRRELPCREFTWCGKTRLVASPAICHDKAGNIMTLRVLLNEMPGLEMPERLKQIFGESASIADLVAWVFGSMKGFSNAIVLMDFELVRKPGGETEVIARCHEDCMKPYLDEMLASLVPLEHEASQAVVDRVGRARAQAQENDEPPFKTQGGQDWVVIFEWCSDRDKRDNNIPEDGETLFDPAHWILVLARKYVEIKTEGGHKAPKLENAKRTIRNQYSTWRSRKLQA